MSVYTLLLIMLFVSHSHSIGSPQVDMASDLALSRHVLHVHKYLTTPVLDFKPLEPATIKHYVAAARNVSGVG